MSIISVKKIAHTISKRIKLALAFTHSAQLHTYSRTKKADLLRYMHHQVNSTFYFFHQILWLDLKIFMLFHKNLKVYYGEQFSP